MRIFLISLFFLVSHVALFAQSNGKQTYDRIFLVSGETIICRILSEDSVHINYVVKEKGLNVTSSVDKRMVDHVTHGQFASQEEETNPFIEKFSLGIGLGLDYGGIGGQASLYVNRNLGFFAGFGYAVAGAGVNGGIKVRLMSEKSRERVIPFLTGMYGYNAVITVPDDRTLDKIFYGSSFGFGLDVHQKEPKNGIWCFELLLPLRGDKPDQYLEMLKSKYGVQFENALIPIAFSIGYRFKFE